MLHNLAGATIQVANLVNYDWHPLHPQEGGNCLDRYAFLLCLHVIVNGHIRRTKIKGMCGSRGGAWGSDPPSLKNHKINGFLSNTGPDPLKNHKLPSQLSMLDHHRPASEMAFPWRTDDGLLLVLFEPPFTISPHQQKKKNVVRVGPPLATLWIRA